MAPPNLGLGPDLWHLIMMHLETPDLKYLMTLSRELYSTVRPHLYRRVRWTWDHSTPERSRPIQQLLINLLRQPKLASLIKEIDVEESGYGCKPRLSGQTPVSHKDQELAMSLVRRSGLQDTEEWIENLQNFDAETIIALIILQLINVQSITINMFHKASDSEDCVKANFSPIGNVLRCILRHETVETNTLSRLTNLAWPSGDFDIHPELYRRSELLDAVPALYLPSLRTASLKLQHPQQPFDLQNLLSTLLVKQQGSKFLTRLFLRDTTIAEPVLAQLLTQMENLEVFHLSLFRDYDMAIYDGALITKALEPCCKVLRHLKVEWGICEFFGDVSTTADTTLGSLHKFTALRHIEATIIALVDDESRLQDILPPGIQKIQIMQHMSTCGSPWEESLLSKLDEFIPIFHLSTPDLSEITVGVWNVGAESCGDYERKCSQEFNLSVRFIQM